MEQDNGDSPDSTTSPRSVRKSGTVPRLFIDADGFPNMELALDIAESHGISIVIVGNYTQNLGRFAKCEGVEIMEVSEGSDAADFAIIPLIEEGDVLLTGDTGLASVALETGARVLGPRGEEFRRETIDYRLHKRHEAKKKIRRGGRGKGPRKLKGGDVERFSSRLDEILKKSRSAVDGNG